MSWSLRWENHWSGRAQDSAKASPRHDWTTSLQDGIDIPSAPAFAAAHAALARIAQDDRRVVTLADPEP